MTLTQLRYVIAAADTGSMNEAAKKLLYFPAQSVPGPQRAGKGDRDRDIFKK